MKYPRPLKRSLDSLHPVKALLSLCYDAADRERKIVDAGHEGTDGVDYDAEQRMLVYGKLWVILLIVWDELMGQDALGYTDQDIVKSLQEAFAGDLDYVMTAMYG